MIYLVTEEDGYTFKTTRLNYTLLERADSEQVTIVKIYKDFKAFNYTGQGRWEEIEGDD